MVNLPLAPGDLLYDYNASGEVSLSRSFEDYPTLQGVRLQVSQSELVTLRAALFKGAAVVALGMPWVVVGMKWSKLLRHQGQCEIVLDLQHPLAPMDSAIVSRRNALDIPTDISGMLDKGVLQLQDLVDYDGQPYRIPFGIPDDELRVTPRELLEQYKRRLHPDGAFLFWGGTRPEARAWGRQTAHDIPRILNETLEVDEPGQGAFVDGLQLTDEAVALEFVPDNSVEFKYDEYQRKVTEPPNGAERYSRHLMGSDVRDLFKGAGDWFDSGGLIKERITEELCNGKLITKRTERYGFVGSSIGGTDSGSTVLPLSYKRSHRIQRDVIVTFEGEGENRERKEEIIYSTIHRPSSEISLEDYWAKVYDVTEYYQWDRDQYLSETWQSGWQMFRFKQESDSLEASESYIKEYQAQDALDAHLATPLGESVEEIAEWRKVKAELEKAVVDARDVGERQRIAYSRFNVIYYDRSNSYTRFSFDFLSNYYRDMRRTNANPGKFCIEETQIKDWARTMIDPEFDPRVTPDNPEDGVPMLVVGERYSMERRVRINTPASRADQRTTQNYQEAKKESNAEGSSFKDRVVTHPITQNDGRPSEHERRDFYGWTKGELEDALGFSIDDVDGDKTLILNTPGTGFTASDPPLGEWSSPGVRLIEEARAAMAVEFSIVNTQNAKTTTLTIPATMAIEEGDTLRYDGEQWIALGLDLTFEIQKGVARCEVMEVKVGRIVAFGGLWQSLYPTADDYPPGLTYPGLSNPPEVVGLLKSYTGAVGRDVVSFFTSPLIVQELVPQAIAPAPIGLGTNPIPTGELNIQPIAPAPIGLGTNPVPVETLYLQYPTVLRRDANWGMHGTFRSKMFFSSYATGAAESATGSLDFGYFERGTASSLWIMLGGGGATNGSLKRVEIRRREGDAIAFISDLTNLLGVNSEDANRWVALPLATLTADELFYLRFIDNDTNSSWAWIGADLDSIIFE